ncbi:MAG: ribosome biogenesis GTP-binding protein YihA/YsxC [Bacteroidota bacterium]|nr:ribosome biogenesis GTP-binding protein YihA/YsxC [Bacteroidota bacterium]
MKIKSSEFIKSSSKVEQCPNTKMPEYAFIGRSNVGKSSLINMLINRKKLASTSSAPGKTRLINHFLINDAWYIADLPGYGYAKRSKVERRQWKAFTDDYFSKRENLACVFVLLDSRREPLPIDIEFMNYLGGIGLPFIMVFTKTDKIGKLQKSQLKKQYEDKMRDIWEYLPEILYTSMVNSKGREEFLESVSQINSNFNK